MLIIRRHVKVIRHNEKPASMTTEEWRSMDEIARSTIRMHLAENIYFSMAKETIVFSLWEKLHGLRKEVLIFKIDFDQTTFQHEDARHRSDNVSNYF